MTDSAQEAKAGGAIRLIDSIEDSEQSTLEAVRKFVDAVDSVFPDLTEDGPRRTIIDSAFKMVEQLVGVSNRLAENVVKVTESAFGGLEGDAPSSETPRLP